MDFLIKSAEPATFLTLNRPAYQLLPLSCKGINEGLGLLFEDWSSSLISS